MPLNCTGQQKQQNGGSPCNLKMTSFVEIIQILIAEKFLIPLGIQNENMEMHDVEGNTFFQAES